MSKTQHPPAANAGTPLPAPGAALEKVPGAAKRSGLSTSQFYRVAKRDGIRIIKVGDRASAVVSADVDAWISTRIAEAGNTKGGHHG